MSCRGKGGGYEGAASGKVRPLLVGPCGGPRTQSGKRAGVLRLMRKLGDCKFCVRRPLPTAASGLVITLCTGAPIL